MTQLDELVPYSGTIPSLIDATDEYTYANEVENYLTWWDVTNTPQLENFRSKLNILSGELQKVADDTVDVYNNTVTTYNNTVETYNDTVDIKNIVAGVANYVGEYDPDTEYQKTESVSIGDIYYVSKVDNNTNEPQYKKSDDYWYCVSNRAFSFVAMDSDGEIKIFDYIDANSELGSFTIYLPQNPNENDMIGVLDVKGTFGDNPIYVDGNGNYIMGEDDEPMTCSNSNMSFDLIFKNGDWRII